MTIGPEFLCPFFVERGNVVVGKGFATPFSECVAVCAQNSEDSEILLSPPSAVDPPPPSSRRRSPSFHVVVPMLPVVRGGILNAECAYVHNMQILSRITHAFLCNCYL